MHTISLNQKHILIFLAIALFLALLILTTKLFIDYAFADCNLQGTYCSCSFLNKYFGDYTWAAVKVASQESACSPSADNGSHAGLFQIAYSPVTYFCGKTWSYGAYSVTLSSTQSTCRDQLKNADTNAIVALAKSNGGTSWCPTWGAGSACEVCTPSAQRTCPQAPCDYNGDGKTDFAVWRPSNGTWYVRNIAKVEYGISTDIPLSGDFNGDGKTDFVVWRPSNGTWYVRDIGNVQWGLPGDVPVPGDYNGDRKTDHAVWRPSNGTWYVRNIATIQYGKVGDAPVPGDYNGDGKTDYAVWRWTDGTWYVMGVGSVQWGLKGDIPVPGDYNGDRKTDFAVWRPSNGIWYVKGIGSVQWGLKGDIPVPGDYNGDRKTDFAVWRPSNGTWYVRNIATVQWGLKGDIVSTIY